MATKVIVQDVSALASYATNIQKIKTELESSSSDLFRLFELVKADITSLTVLTNIQKKNWMDPQFDALRLRIEQCINAVNSTSLLLRETSLMVSTQLGEIDQSIIYINNAQTLEITNALIK